MSNIYVYQLDLPPTGIFLKQANKPKTIKSTPILRKSFLQFMTRNMTQKNKSPVKQGF